MEVLISLIVPIYKTEEELRDCIDSILEQTYTNFELILLEDGSPDNCGRICDEYAIKDSRIRVIHKENTGVSDTRNMGIQLATGLYIGFVDSDDKIEKNMLECWKKVIDEKQPDMLICDYEIEGSTTSKKTLSLQEGIIKKEEFWDKLYKEEYYGGYLWNKLFHRKLFQLDSQTPILLNPELKIMEDLVVISKLAQDAKSIYYINQKLYVYRDRLQSALHTTFQLSIKKNIYQAYIELIPLIQKNSRQNLSMFQIRQCKECAHLLSLLKCTYRQDELLEKEVRKKIKETINIVKKSQEISLKEKIKIWLYFRFPYICGILKTRGKEKL